MEGEFSPSSVVLGQSETLLPDDLPETVLDALRRKPRERCKRP
jgi:hypothetical protein